MDKNIEIEIRNLVRNEIMECFKDLQSDVLETKEDIKIIKLALLGDELYNHRGIVDQVKENSEYISRNKTLNIAEDGLKVIDWHKDWSTPNNGYKTSRLELLSEIMSVYSNIKWLIGAAITLGVVNVAQIIFTIIGYFNK